MHKKHVKRLFHSVFFRLIAAITIAGILMTLTVMGGFYTMKETMAETFRRNFAQYIHYLIEDIGDPPDRIRAKAIADHTDMNIHFENPETAWTVPESATVPDFSNPNRLWHDSRKVQVGGSRHGHFIKVHHGGGQLIFWRLKSDAFEQQAAKAVVKVCVVMLLILTGAYLYIRRVMQPVRWMTAAMDQYGDGNLDYRMPLRRADEFQDLAEAVNRMADRIQALLEAKEKLLLDVSHELRTPIARLKVGIELLSDEEDKASLSEDLAEMEAMVKEILEAARLRQSAASLNVQKVESGAFIQSVAEEFRERPPGIQLMTIEETTLLLDPQKARTVLKNVIDNAVKYSHESQAPVEIEAKREEARYRITVQDFGIGIPADDLKRVFEPFFRVDLSRSRATGGFGLGLSLCKAIMEAHGGDIRIESELGQGTRVIISFPIDPD